MILEMYCLDISSSILMALFFQDRMLILATKSIEVDDKFSFLSEIPLSFRNVIV